MQAKRSIIFVMLFFMALLNVAHADSDDYDDDTAPLRLTMDQTKMIHLQQDASNIILNNPEHASVDIDNPRLLLVTPHEPGATSMIVLDKDGNEILQQDIIVTNVQPKYVRIRRMCAAGGDCVPTSYNYCPDGCYEVTAIPANGGGAGVPPPPSAPPNTIGGEPAETLIGPADDCPAGFNKIFVPGISTGDQHYTCTKR